MAISFIFQKFIFLLKNSHLLPGNKKRNTYLEQKRFGFLKNTLFGESF